MRIISLILGMTVFTCGEQESGGTGEGGTTDLTSASSSSGGMTEVPTGTVSESASATEAPTGGETGTGSSASTGSMTDTGTGVSTGVSTAGESSVGDSTGGEVGTTGEGIVLDAALNDACAPDDGPALALRPGLIAPMCEADWSDESLRIVIFMAAPLGPGVYPLGEGLGFATRQGMDDPEFVSGVQGSVTIESWDGAAVVGSYSVTFMDASVREGGFSGPYCDDDILCG